jgi:hypothetical protein
VAVIHVHAMFNSSSSTSGSMCELDCVAAAASNAVCYRAWLSDARQNKGE